MPNQSRTIKSMVPKGTAPDDPFIQRKRLRRNMIPNTIVGRTVAVMNAFFFASVPPRDL